MKNGSQNGTNIILKINIYGLNQYFNCLIIILN